MHPSMEKRLAAETEARFWSKVARTDGCWMWLGSRYHFGKNRPGEGYGQFVVRKGVHAGAHRFAWMLVNGEIPPGKQVQHRCDEPGCVRPEHLRLGTQAQNVRDAARKGRINTSSIGKAIEAARDPACRARGEAHPNAVLTDDAVRAIREGHACGESYSKLMARFSVSKGTVANVVTRKIWKHIP